MIDHNAGIFSFRSASSFRADDSENGPDAADLAARTGGPNAEERVLHDIVDIAHAGKRPLHGGAQGAAVRIDLFSEPAGLIGGGRHRDEDAGSGKGAGGSSAE